MASTPRWGGLRPEPYDPDAVDADHDGIVNTSWGEPMHYTSGNDYIVRHGLGDYGVVKVDIFNKTYEKV